MLSLPFYLEGGGQIFADTKTNILEASWFSFMCKGTVKEGKDALKYLLK
jgi:hypothetical protein